MMSLTQQTWLRGPDLKYSTGGHACSTLPTSRMSDKESIIVAGGWDNKRKASSIVQILDEDSNEWRIGPELPFPIAGAAMVKHPGNNVIYILASTDASRN